MMKRFALFAALLAAAPIVAQAPVPAPGASGRPPAFPAPFLTAADVQAFIASSRAGIKPDQTGIFKSGLSLPPYSVALEYRVARAGANVHPREAEFIHVVAGSGTIVTGGTLIDAKTRPDGNIGGTGITGGTAHHLVAGDTMIVPEGVPHSFSPADKELVMITMKLPRTPAQ